MQKEVTVYDANKGRYVRAGMLTGTCFGKEVPPNNIMKKIFKDCIGISDKVIEELSRAGCKYIAIAITGQPNVYISLFSQWETHFTGRADFGHGGQTFLSVHNMKVTPLEGFDPYRAEAIYASARN